MRSDPATRPVLQVRNLVKDFPVGSTLFGTRPARRLRAVAGISFDVMHGETFGLVGESGCGKSTLGRAILRLIEPTSGVVILDGAELTTLPAEELRRSRRDIQIVFQDPMSSLHPRMKVRRILAEGLRLAELDRDAEAHRIAELIELVRLPAETIDRYPHEMSGGQRQRVGIARAISLDPKVIVLDEPVSALDVSVQTGILNLLRELQDRLGIAFVFVAHDLGVVRYVSDRIGVMYLGRLVEIGPAEEVFVDPQHPYTQALLAAIPRADPRAERTRKRAVLSGDLPSPLDPPSGCAFRTRCPRAAARCADEHPELAPDGADRRVACHFPGPAKGPTRKDNHDTHD